MSNNAQACVGHYKLDDNAASTAVVDDTGTKNGVYKDGIGAVNTSTGASTGVINGAIDFDTDEWVDVAGLGQTIKTIVMWCNPDAINVTGTLIDLNGTDFLNHTNATITPGGFSGGVQVIYVDGEVSATVTAGNWHMVAITSTTGYLANGVDIARLQGTDYFDGYLDNIMLFTRTLSPDEIKALYNAGNGLAHVGELDRAEQFTRTLRRQ